MPNSRLSVFAITSVILHALILLFLASEMFRNMVVVKRLPVSPPPPSLTMLKIQPPPQKPPSPKSPAAQFVPTESWQQTDKPDPNALLESERNTALRSREVGTTDSPLPQMSGNPKAGLNYTDSPRSQERLTQPQPLSPPPTPVDPTEAKEPSANPQTKPPVELAPFSPKTEIKPEPDPADPNALPVLPAPPQPQDTPNIKPQTRPPNPKSPTTQETSLTQKPSPQQQPDPDNPTPSETPKQPQRTKQEQIQPSPPPTPFSFSRERTKIEGGHNYIPGDPSPSAKESELGRYKSKVYRTIGSRWLVSVDENMKLLGVGDIHIKFFVRANGTIDQFEVISESGSTEVLHNLSMRAIKDSQPFPVFSDNMKQQMGEGYWEDITFTIY